MKSFKDNAGRTWILSVNVAAVKRVRALCGVDLNSIVEIDAEGRASTKLMERLYSDPVLLVDVLYAVCKPECDTMGISDEDFGRSMAGDAIEDATDALLDGIVDFFPEAKRMALRRILDAVRRFGETVKSKLMESVSGEEFENIVVSRLEQLTGLSSNAPASAVFNLTDSR